MEMRLVRVTLALAAALSLGSCQVVEFLFGSVFPATATLAKARADLSGQIPAGSGQSFNVRVIENGTNAYVVVIGNGPSGNSAYFYDLDLNSKTSFSGFSGNAVLVDSLGNIALGSILLNPATLAQTASLPGATVLYPGATCGVDGFVTGSSVIASFAIQNGSSSLSSMTYTTSPSWSTGTSNTAVSLSSSSVQLNAVLDGGSLAPNVTLVVSHSGSNNNSSTTCYFVTTAKSGFPTGAPSADSSPSHGNLESSTIGWASGSVFAYESSSASFIRIDPATGNTQDSFPSSEDPSETHYAYRINGGSYYGFDTKARVLTKYAQWWQ